MQRCLVSGDLFELEDIPIEGDLAHHLRDVLRIKQGEKLSLLDGAGHRKEAVVAEVSRHTVRVATCGNVETVARAWPDITLFQCVIKNASMDWVVEKAAELGVATLVPVVAQRSVVKHDEGAVNKRWQRIADSALEQCGNVWRMDIAPVCGFPSALQLARGIVPTFVGALSADAKPIRDALAFAGASERMGWFVGPEGDFSEEELFSLCSSGAIPVTLGKNVLRSETAAVFGLSVMRALT